MSEFSLQDLFERMAQSAEPGEAMPARRQLAVLRECGPAYFDPPVFRKGDIVTPRANSPVMGHGYPCMVVDVDMEAKPVLRGNYGAFQFGCRPQIRIVKIVDGHLVPYWQEAAWYEPYTEAMAALADATPGSSHRN